tara:strand:+ start:56 stop:472 length:417 start_codon:yes stop_codon:yes gene_type:complete
MRRGITLIEALIASALLLTVVTAVLSALSAGHQHAREAQGLVTASLAAEQLMARVSSDEYGSLADWNGWDEAPGAMVDDADMPAIFSMIGRRVLIAREEHAIDHLQVLVNGYTVTVESYDATGRILTRLIRFIPEPQA